MNSVSNWLWKQLNPSIAHDIEDPNRVLCNHEDDPIKTGSPTQKSDQADIALAGDIASQGKNRVVGLAAQKSFPNLVQKEPALRRTAWVHSESGISCALYPSLKIPCVVSNVIHDG